VASRIICGVTAWLPAETMWPGPLGEVERDRSPLRLAKRSPDEGP